MTVDFILYHLYADRDNPKCQLLLQGAVHKYVYSYGCYAIVGKHYSMLDLLMHHYMITFYRWA